MNTESQDSRAQARGAIKGAPTDAQIDQQVREVYTAQGPRGLMMLCKQLLAEHPAPSAALAAPAASPEPVSATDEIVGAMHRCRKGDRFARCVMCGAMAEQLAKPCKGWLAEAHANADAIAPSPPTTPPAKE